MFVELSFKYSFPQFNHNRAHYYQSQTPQFNRIYATPIDMILITCNLTILGGNHCQECLITMNIWNIDCNIKSRMCYEGTCHRLYWRLWNIFNRPTMLWNFVSHLVNFYKDQGLETWIKGSQGMLKKIWSGFHTNFDQYYPEGSLIHTPDPLWQLNVGLNIRQNMTRPSDTAWHCSSLMLLLIIWDKSNISIRAHYFRSDIVS